MTPADGRNRRRLRGKSNAGSHFRSVFQNICTQISLFAPLDDFFSMFGPSVPCQRRISFWIEVACGFETLFGVAGARRIAVFWAGRELQADSQAINLRHPPRTYICSYACSGELENPLSVAEGSSPLHPPFPNIFSSSTQLSMPPLAPMIWPQHIVRQSRRSRIFLIRTG